MFFLWWVFTKDLDKGIPFAVYQLRFSAMFDMIFSNQELQTSLSTSVTVSTAKRSLLIAQSLRAPRHDVDPVRLTKASLPSSHLRQGSGSPGPMQRGRGAVVCPKLVKFVLCYMSGLDMYRCIHNMHSMYVYIHIIESTTIYHLSSSRTRNFPPKSPSLPNAEVGEVKRLSGRSLED